MEKCIDFSLQLLKIVHLYIEQLLIWAIKVIFTKNYNQHPEKGYNQMSENNTSADTQRSFKQTFYDLTPVDSITGESTSFEALDFAIKNKDVTIFAITGPYGSGKSSLWRSYTKNKQETKKDKLVNKYLKNSLNVSLAKLCRSSQTPDDNKSISNVQSVNINTVNTADETDIDQRTELDIERVILQKMFYSEKSEKYDSSIIKTTFYVFDCLSKLAAVIFSILTSLIITSEYFDNLLTIFPCSAIIILFSFALTGLIYGLLAKLVVFFNHFGINSLKAKDVEISFEQVSNESLLNKNLSQIIYFFEVSKKKLVIFEDLDRFNSNLIFVKLRELNQTLNNSPNLMSEKEPIKFLFMVKDDVFPKYKITKFFDFILPVIPVLNGDNAADFITDEFVKNGGPLSTLSPKYLFKIQPYLNDLRLLKNCVNEFMIYKQENQKYIKTLKNQPNSEKIDLIDEKIFSLILYKNLYSKDYSNLLKQKGVLFECLNTDLEQLLSQFQELQA